MERREASRANQWARAAMTGPGTREAMADQGSPWPWPLALGQATMAMDICHVWGALGRSGVGWTLGRSRHLRALVRSGHLRHWRSGHWSGLARSRHWRVLMRSGLWSWAPTHTLRAALYSHIQFGFSLNNSCSLISVTIIFRSLLFISDH